MADAGKITVRMDLDASGVRTGAQQARQSLNDLQNDLNNLNNAGQNAGQNISNSMADINKGLDKAMGTGKKLTAMLTLPLVGFGLSAIKVTKDFDYSMSEVSAISGATGKDLERLEEQAKELGKTTFFSATEASQGMKYYAMAGWEVQDILNVMPATLNLAIAGNTDLALTCDIVSDAMTALKIETKDAIRFTDIMASTASSSNTSIQMLGESYKYCAPVAGELGIKAEDLSVALGLMANSGLKSTVSGNMLKTGLLRMVKPTEQIQKAMDKYGISLQLTEDGSVDLMETMTHLRNKLGGLDKVTRANVLSTLMGKEATAGWSSVVGATEKDFNKLTEAIYNSDGSAQKMADTMGNNLEGKLKNLESAFEGVQIVVGDIFMPMVGKLVDKLTDLCTWFTELDTGTQKVILAIGGAVAVVGPLMIAFAGLGKLALALKTGFMAITGAMGITVTAGTALAVGIGAVAVAFAGLLGWMGSSSEMIAWLQDKFGGFGTFLGGLGEFIYGVFQFTFGNIGILAVTLGKMLMALMKGDFKEAGALWQDGWAKIEANSAKALSNMNVETSRATAKMREMTADELNGMKQTYEEIFGGLKTVTDKNIGEVASSFTNAIKDMDTEAIMIMGGTSETMEMLLNGINSNLSDDLKTEQFVKNLETMKRAGKLELNEIDGDFAEFVSMIERNMKNGEQQLTNAGSTLFSNFKNVATRGIDECAEVMVADINKMDAEVFTNLQSMGGTWGAIFAGIKNDGSMSTEEMKKVIIDNYNAIGLSSEEIMANMESEQAFFYAKSRALAQEHSDATKTTIDSAMELFNNFSLMTADNMDYVTGVMADGVSKMNVETLASLTSMGTGWEQVFAGIDLTTDTSSSSIKAKMLENITAMQSEGTNIVNLFRDDLTSYFNSLEGEASASSSNMATNVTGDMQAVLNMANGTMPAVANTVATSTAQASASASTNMAGVKTAIESNTNVSSTVAGNMAGVNNAIASATSGATKVAEENTKGMQNAIDKNTKNLSKTAETNFKNIDRSAKSNFTNATNTVKKEATSMYNGAKNSFSKLATEASKSMSNLKTSVLNYTSDMRKGAIDDWNAIRNAYSKAITGTITINKTEKTNKIVATTTSNNDGSKAVSLASTLFNTDNTEMYARQEAMRSFTVIEAGDKMAVDSSDNRGKDKEKTKETASNNNITYNYTYNSPKETSISELRRKDRVQAQRLALSFK